ncbi:MAG TPA: hypothetical protein VKY19_21885 [Ktedonosporobacter sp.]|jgi:hypothetical protein|nr:hypothetical protein [Ktedonosporobacter sp.]
MSQNDSFWREEWYEELAQLHLPGPSVVIDVRRGADRDPSVIRNIGMELKELSTEMELHQVYRWRYLTNCIDLFKLVPSHWEDGPANEATHFTLIPLDGRPEPLSGKKELVDELVREHLDVVRTNRISAGSDHKTNFLGATIIDPAQATVRVFFLVDAEDTDSLLNAAVYAQWLRSAYHEGGDAARSGRDKRISTIAICMNMNPYVHHPHLLAQHLNYDAKGHPALDAVILLYTYSDNDAYIGGSAQLHQVELTLYSLLLCPLESLAEFGECLLGEQRPGAYVYHEENSQLTALPWPIFIVGISSLEYSARWGARWLDYGLVAKIIEVIHEDDVISRGDENEKIQKAVQKEVASFLREIHALLFGGVADILPEIRVFKALNHFLASSPFREKGLTASVQELNAFVQQVVQFYIGNDHSLENSLAGAHLIPEQIKKGYLRVAGDESHDATKIHELYQRLLQTQSHAVYLPISLFEHVRGSMPRAFQQLSELEAHIEAVRRDAGYLLDLKDAAAQFQWQANNELRTLKRLTDNHRWPFTGRVQRQREACCSRLKIIVQHHMNQVKQAITARVALALLREVGLYDPENKLCLFHERLKKLDAAMQEARPRASLEKQRAYRRLAVSLRPSQGRPSLGPLKLRPDNRQDWLDLTQITESFESAARELEATPEYLELLVKWLFLLIGGADPVEIVVRHLHDNAQRREKFTAVGALVQMEMHVYSTMLVAVLLLFNIMSFKLASVQQLLDQYNSIRKNAPVERSILETDIMGLQSIVREARAMRNNMEGTGQAHQFSGSSPLHHQLLELTLAAWVNNLYAEDPALVQVLDRSGILARLAKEHNAPAQVLKDLQARNRLPGYRDTMAGDDAYYLLLPPGKAGDDFLREAALAGFAHIRTVRFPDPEKLIYLHIHRIHQAFPGLVLPSP